MRTSALFLLFLLLSVPAAAQVTCNTFAQPVTVRADGLSENTGDIVLLCSGGTVPAAGAVLPQFDIIVSLNTNITSRLLVAPATEALLFIDDPQPGTQSPCAPANGNTVCSPMYRGV